MLVVAVTPGVVPTEGTAVGEVPNVGVTTGVVPIVGVVVTVTGVCTTGVGWPPGTIGVTTGGVTPGGYEGTGVFGVPFPMGAGENMIESFAVCLDLISCA